MIVFIIQPIASHYFPTISLAKKFVERGEKVVYTVTPKFSRIIEVEDFEYHEFDYMSEYVIRSTKTLFGFLLKNLVSEQFYNVRKREFEIAHKETKTLINKYQPKHVFVDQSIADYYFFLKPYIKDITILHTKVYSGKTRGIPPMNSLFMPNSTWHSRLICEWTWFKLLFKQRWTELLLKIAFLGKDEAYFWKRHCEKYGMEWKKQTDFKHSLNRGVKGVNSIILAPRDLEFSNFTLPKKITFHGQLSQKNETECYSFHYVQFKKYLARNRNINKMALYLAFGTLATDQPKVQKFYNDTISTCAKIDNILLIVSTGGAPLKLSASNNSFVFDFVPQQDVLSYADLFITHGGLGSVKEAYHAKVPMLVVPLNTKIDQPGNAARVKARGHGDYLNLEKYSKKELQQKIIRLLPQNKIKSTPASAINNQLV